MNATRNTERLAQAEQLYQQSLTDPESVIPDLATVVDNVRYGLDESVDSALTVARIQVTGAKTLRQLTKLSTPIEALGDHLEALIGALEARQAKLNAAARAERMMGIVSLLEVAQLNTLRTLRRILVNTPDADWEPLMELYPQFVSSTTRPAIKSLYLLQTKQTLRYYEEPVVEYIGDLSQPLMSEAPPVRQQAINVLTALATIEPEAAAGYMSDIVSLLDTGRVELEQAVLELCFELATTAPELVTPYATALEARLSSESRAVRWTALQAVSAHPELADSRTRDLQSEVIRALDAPDPETRELAASILQDCQSLIPSENIPIDPLVEHQSQDAEVFTRAVYDICRKVAEEHPDRVAPHLDALLDPDLYNQDMKRVRVTSLGFAFARSAPELLIPHLDTFVSIALSRKDNVDHAASAINDYARQFREAARMSQNSLARALETSDSLARALETSETLQTKRAVNWSHRRVLQQSEFDLDPDSTEVHRRSSIGILSILIRSAPQSPEVKPAIQAVSTALLVENESVRNRAIAGLDSVLGADRTAFMTFIPLYLRAVQKYTAEGTPTIRRRVLMILARSCEAAYQADAVEVFSENTLRQILELPSTLESADAQLAAIDYQLLAHVIKNATRTVLNNHESSDTIDLGAGLDSTAPETASSAHESASSSRGPQSTALLDEHLFSLAAAPRLYSTHSLFKVLESWAVANPKPVVPHIRTVMEIIVAVSDRDQPPTDAVTAGYENTLGESTLIATEDVPEAAEAIANTLVATTVETLEAGFALLETVAQSAPAALLPHLDTLESMASDTDTPGTKHLYAALCAMTHAYPEQTTDLATTFVDGLYRSGVVAEISSEALTTLADTVPTTLTPHTTSIAATLRTDASAATLLNASYTLRLLAEMNPTILDDVASIIESQIPVTAPQEPRLTDGTATHAGTATAIINATNPSTELIREHLDACLRIHDDS